MDAKTRQDHHGVMHRRMICVPKGVITWRWPCSAALPWAGEGRGPGFLGRVNRIDPKKAKPPVLSQGQMPFGELRFLFSRNGCSAMAYSVELCRPSWGKRYPEGPIYVICAATVLAQRRSCTTATIKSPRNPHRPKWLLTQETCGAKSPFCPCGVSPRRDGVSDTIATSSSDSGPRPWV